MVTMITLLIIPSASLANDDIPRLENPMSVEYLQNNLLKNSPRLILTPKLLKKVKRSVKKNEVVSNVYQAFLLNSDEILKQPLLERKMTGRRLLGVSREMLYRVNILGMVYLQEGDKSILTRINEEILSVCKFSDWNPSHYLDVAEMSLAVALAIDWLAEDLPANTISMAKNALIVKGIKPSYNTEGNVSWINGTNNWNQVCHAGMIAAAIATADVDPELSSKTISRALEGIPHALVEYGPDGVYPEGSTYWSYGTSFTVMTASMLRSAFSTDFGLAEFPAFKESADFKVLSNAPSDWYYNFADCGDQRKKRGDMVLAWFAAETGNSTYYEKQRFLIPPSEMGELSRYAGAGLVWLADFKDEGTKELPKAWKGDGSNPVVFFLGNQSDDYYFGGKGGRGTVNHGNMDAGSFVFELNGVRWVVDPGNQNYNDLEKTGFNLWGRCQDCERWTLLTKNNYGHSTLTVNKAFHITDGMADIVEFEDGIQPKATVDLSATFGDNLASAKRTFIKENDQSLLIEDRFIINENTKTITWQLMTTADVEFTAEGAQLLQEGKRLSVELLSHPELKFSVTQLDPPPLKLDRTIQNLKRLEVSMPAYLFEDKEQIFIVKLQGE